MSPPLTYEKIAAIIRGASKYYIREETAAGKVLTKEAAIIKAAGPKRVGFERQPDATRFRSRLEKVGDKFNKDQAKIYVDQIVDEVIFLAGGEDATTSAGRKLNRTHIEDYVRINIFQGASYTEDTGIFINAPVLQPFASGESWQNFANMELNRKSKELERDPSMPLFEDKLRHVLVEIVESNPDLEPLAGLILSADVLKAEGIAPPDRTDDDYAAAVAFYSDDVGQILNYTKESIRNESYSFLDGTGRGNFGSVLSGAVREDLYDFVGPIPQTTQVPPIDHKKFMTNDEYFNKTIDIWLEENGAVIKPSDNPSVASDPYLVFGYASANRELIAKYKKSRKNYIENSDMNKTANKGAEKEGLDTDQ